jgi:hypothetical protein
MRLQDLFETQSTRTLYRGDASKIEQFSTEYTKHSLGLLFGMGIYLTDNPRIALDYTIKGGYRRDGGGSVVVYGEIASEADAVGEYIKTIMARELGWEQHREKMKTDAMINHSMTMKPYPSRLDASGNPNPELVAYREAQKKFQDDFYMKMKAEFASFVKRAKAIYKQRKPDLKVFQDTTGNWQIVHRDHPGTITAFEIPEDYLARTLHGDRPLEGKTLELVRAFVKGRVGDHPADFRDRSHQKFYPFDEWLEVFRKDGAVYAWRDEDIGGKGVYPSLDEVWNGTHAGYSIFYEGMERFIEMATQAGFTGIEYDGGVRTSSQHVRGGGGIRHQSFVLWDDKYVNARRKEQSQVTYDDPNPNVLRSVRTNKLYTNWSDL